MRRLALAPSVFAVRVLGCPVAAPFAGVAFCPVRQAFRPGPLPVRYAAGAARVVRRERPALIEVHNRPDVAHALRGLGPPVTLFLHNDPVGMRGFRHIATVDRVVAVSRWVADRTGRADCQVLPNPINLAEIPRSPAVRENVVLFVGRVVADKGVDSFVAACAQALPRLPGWRAEVIGADGFGNGARETPFVRRLRPLAQAAGVAMLGWRPHEEVLRAMARAAIVVVPSRWPEPFGMTALEAMACGAAVIYAPRGGLPEVVGDAGVPVDPESAQGIARSIVALVEDPSRRRMVANRAVARAAANDIVVVARELDSIRGRSIVA